MHHALYDGASIGLLVNAVEEFYQSRSCHYDKQFHEVLPDILLQQRDGVDFWVQKLARFTPNRLQRLRSSQNSTSVTLERNIPFNASRVKAALSEASVTMQCVSQAAWAKVIGKYTGVPDVVFGHTVSGRSIPGAEDVIGPVLVSPPENRRDLSNDLIEYHSMLRSLGMGYTKHPITTEHSPSQS